MPADGSALEIRGAERGGAGRGYTPIWIADGVGVIEIPGGCHLVDDAPR